MTPDAPGEGVAGEGAQTRSSCILSGRPSPGLLATGEDMLGHISPLQSHGMDLCPGPQRTHTSFPPWTLASCRKPSLPITPSPEDWDMAPEVTSAHWWDTRKSKQI